MEESNRTVLATRSAFTGRNRPVHTAPIASQETTLRRTVAPPYARPLRRINRYSSAAATINTAVFGVHTPQAFYDRLFAPQPDPKTGKPDPEKMARFRSA